MTRFFNFFWLITLIILSSCSSYALYNHNVLDFSPAGTRRVSGGLMNFYTIPYRAYFSVVPVENHRVSINFGEREFGASYLINFYQREWFNFGAGINMHIEFEGGMRLKAEEESDNDDVKVPENKLIEAPLSLTYLKNKVIGWISLKSGIWIVDEYPDPDNENEVISAQQQLGITVGAGFGYYDLDGFTALLVFNRPYYHINGEFGAENFFGIIVGMNFEL